MKDHVSLDLYSDSLIKKLGDCKAGHKKTVTLTFTINSVEARSEDRKPDSEAPVNAVMAGRRGKHQNLTIRGDITNVSYTGGSGKKATAVKSPAAAAILKGRQSEAY